MAWETTSNYFSGQGVVMLGDRDPVTGKGINFIPVGNVADLKIDIATSVVEHKEAQSGARGIDLRLTTEVKANVSMTMENFNPTNVALALRGAFTPVTGDDVIDEANVLNFGAIATLDHIGVSAVAARRGATTLTEYTTPTAAWDYKANLDSGSIMFNDGQGGALIDALTTLGEEASTPFAAVSGSKLTITFDATPAHATVGKKMAIVGAAGTDAAFVNGKAFVITAKTGTTVEVELGATGKTITGAITTLCVFDGDATIEFDYTHASQSVINALTESASEKFVRFEGLNTADGNKPVVVEVFRMLSDPLKELALISATVQQFVVTGSILMDAVQTGSKYFRQTMLA